MYSACLFCHAPLGTNELVESFPVGRRLAYDAAKGRLWVVCRRCERWNLTPLDERWKAIDECERLFRDTRTRVATGEIGLARLRDGQGAMQIVRIGRPLLPEYAAWRYGDQFGRRRRRYFAMSGAALLGVGTVVVAGPLTGLISTSLLFNTIHIGSNLWHLRNSRTPLRIPSSDGTELRIRRHSLGAARICGSGADWRLELPVMVGKAKGAPRLGLDTNDPVVTLTGSEALRAMARLLPLINKHGAGTSRVQEAVDLVERHDAPALFDAARAASTREAKRKALYPSRAEGSFQYVPRPLRLALEMVAHEESERRALEGELTLLEASWREAEAIAEIADSL